MRGLSLIVSFSVLTLCACGGSGGNTSVTGGGGEGGGGSNGGGGTGGNTPTIARVSPSQIMTVAGSTTDPIVYGSNFTSASVVQINGAAVQTTFQSATELWASPAHAELTAPGVYSITVSDPTGLSNAVSLTVYSPNQGPQPFLALPGYYTGPQQSPAAIAIADFNGDGRADVVLSAGASTSNIALLLGQTNGALGPPQFFPGGAMALAAGNVNGDGFPDIVAGNYPPVGSNSATTSSITVMLNDGTGNFTPGVSQTFTGTFPGPMALTNILGTGRNDLLVASHNPDVLYLFPNQGNGTFGQPLPVASLGPDRWFAVADFDGDGNLDIAYSGLNSSSRSENTHLLLNQGGGTFNDVVPAALANVGGIVVAGDFNNDGRFDLAIEVDQGTSSVVLDTFLNTGGNSFAEASSITLGVAGSVPYHWAVGDFDHDGFLDIAGENGSGVPASMLVLWGDGTGNFTSQQVVGPSSFDLASGDVNGDGIADIIIPDELLAATIVLGQSGRSYPQPTSVYPEVASQMGVGDVNGDGAPDLFFAGDSIHQIPGCIFLNDGHGNFSLAGRPPYDATMIADLTGSGKADLSEFTGNSLTIWPGTGDPNYSTAPLILPVPANFGGLAGFQAVDLDGDGKPDLIGENGIAWNLGNYQFDFVPMNMNGVFAVGDVNNDGRPDLITANGTFLNLGSRQFSQISSNGLPLVDGYAAALGDFNGDGKPDIAFAMLLDEPFVTVAYGNGDGTFYVQSILAATDYGTGTGNVVGIVAGDFNGDGIDDVITPIVFGTHVMLYTSDGKGEFETSFVATGAGPESIAKADFNLDGKPDIVIFDPTAAPPSNAVVVFGR